MSDRPDLPMRHHAVKATATPSVRAAAGAAGMRDMLVPLPLLPIPRTVLLGAIRAPEAALGNGWS